MMIVAAVGRHGGARPTTGEALGLASSPAGSTARRRTGHWKIPEQQNGGEPCWSVRGLLQDHLQDAPRYRKTTQYESRTSLPQRIQGKLVCRRNSVLLPNFRRAARLKLQFLGLVARLVRCIGEWLVARRDDWCGGSPTGTMRGSVVASCATRWSTFQRRRLPFWRLGCRPCRDWE